ncbi:hypothetical protein [Halorussus aquaticus]|uniref:Small CPxCG-related zinc finger protein n=1 Tax=Halorussus aquaticus TaxID=2953748 RepID=A0ABD5PZ30_9EURY|nr:hypothetical protein [Halorussus aquaticus]
MDTGITAIERCAYCREYVPITVLPVAPEDGPISAEVAVCEACRTGGR